MTTLNGDGGTPGLLWGLRQWCEKRNDFPSKSDCPRPSLHTPRGHLSPYPAPGLSDLMSSLCPGKWTMKTGHLSSLCCTVGLALCVEHDWRRLLFWLLFGQESSLTLLSLFYLCLRPWYWFPLQGTTKSTRVSAHIHCPILTHVCRKVCLEGEVVQ